MHVHTDIAHHFSVYSGNVCPLYREVHFFSDLGDLIYLELELTWSDGLLGSVPYSVLDLNYC